MSEFTLKAREDHALVHFLKELFSDIDKLTFLKFLKWWADLRIVFFFSELPRSVAKKPKF